MACLRAVIIALAFMICLTNCFFPAASRAVHLLGETAMQAGVGRGLGLRSGPGQQEHRFERVTWGVGGVCEG